MKATEYAAIAVYPFIGRGDEEAADAAAVAAMRKVLNAMEMKGRVCIGEGERDAAPMLYIGETLGSGRGLEVDIAVDPLEGTTLTAKAMKNALTVAAMAPRGALLHAPDLYMDKIAVGGGLPKGTISLDAEVGDNINALAKARGRKASEITACVLDRPRHETLIAQLRKVGVSVFLISDGDIAGAIQTVHKESGIDIYMGVGGAPEGVLAAAALSCIGGQMEGRLVFSGDDQRKRAAEMGMKDPAQLLTLKDMVKGDIIFAASGVTAGSLLGPVRVGKEGAHVHSLLMKSQGAGKGVQRYIQSDYPYDG